MEHNDPSRRPYAQYHHFSGQQQQQQQQQHQHHQQPPSQQQQQQQQQQQPSPQNTAQTTTGHYSGSTGSFRQASFVQQSPTTNTPTGTRGGNDAAAYAFAQTSQYGGTASASAQSMQFGPALQTPEAQRQQGAQRYPQYAGHMVYGMAAPPTQMPSQQPTQSPYEPQVSPYGQRAGAASETYAAAFGVSQPAGYYLASQTVPTTAAAAAADMPATTLQAQFHHTLYPQQSQPPTPSFGGTLPQAPTGAFAAYPSQTSYMASATQPTDQAFHHYQNQVSAIFAHAREGTLAASGALLLSVSQYLLGNVEQLGLTRDDERLHDDRIRLWDEFNRAWLVTLQRQVDMTRDMLQTNQPLRAAQSLMDSATLEHLSRELVRACDNLERHGLVDYQMGVAEEEIIDLLLRCLALFDPAASTDDSFRPEAEASTAAAKRTWR